MIQLNRIFWFSCLLLCFHVKCFAAGCTGKVLFEDNFANLDNFPNLKLNPSMGSVAGGKLTLTPAADKNSWDTYKGDVFQDSDICLTLKQVHGLTEVKKDSAVAGFRFLFWFIDPNNFYELLLWPETSQFNVDRYVSGRSLSPSAAQTAPAIKGIGLENNIQISVRGTVVKYYVNDQELTLPSAPASHPPDGGGMIGFVASAVKDEKDVWEVSKLKVTSPQ